MTSFVPAGFHSITPYITVDGADAAIKWYGEAFGATEVMRMPMGDKIGHAEILIGDSHLMLSDEWEHVGKLSPKARGGVSVAFTLYLADVDAAFAKAIAAGATELRPVQNQFYGDRSGTLIDPFGHEWTIAKHVEDVSEGEMNRRMAELMQGA